jgi:glycine/D-amino acid oxidase-like deaminating enzyme
LWTAHELLDREPGIRVALLEADICGGGASGRNGGFFSSSWHDLPRLCRLFGQEPSRRYASALADQVGEVGAWLTANGIDAWFHHEGILGLETNAQQLGSHKEALTPSRKLGLDVIEPRSIEEVRRIADTPAASEARSSYATAPS